jgi:hypothetical protein
MMVKGYVKDVLVEMGLNIKRKGNLFKESLNI